MKPAAAGTVAVVCLAIGLIVGLRCSGATDAERKAWDRERVVQLDSLRRVYEKQNDADAIVHRQIDERLAVLGDSLARIRHRPPVVRIVTRELPADTVAMQAALDSFAVTEMALAHTQDSLQVVRDSNRVLGAMLTAQLGIRRLDSTRIVRDTKRIADLEDVLRRVPKPKRFLGLGAHCGVGLGVASSTALAGIQGPLMAGCLVGR